MFLTLIWHYATTLGQRLDATRRNDALDLEIPNLILVLNTKHVAKYNSHVEISIHVPHSLSGLLLSVYG